jgi:hypothetical protein
MYILVQNAGVVGHEEVRGVAEELVVVVHQEGVIVVVAAVAASPVFSILPWSLAYHVPIYCHGIL